MKAVELDLLNQYIYTKEQNGFVEDQLRAELEVENSTLIACRILDALNKY
jgi:hypothetical protein